MSRDDTAADPPRRAPLPPIARADQRAGNRAMAAAVQRQPAGPTPAAPAPAAPGPAPGGPGAWPRIPGETPFRPNAFRGARPLVEGAVKTGARVLGRGALVSGSTTVAAEAAAIETAAIEAATVTVGETVVAESATLVVAEGAAASTAGGTAAAETGAAAGLGGPWAWLAVLGVIVVGGIVYYVVADEAPQPLEAPGPDGGAPMVDPDAGVPLEAPSLPGGVPMVEPYDGVEVSEPDAGFDDETLQAAGPGDRSARLLLKKTIYVDPAGVRRWIDTDEPVGDPQSGARKPGDPERGWLGPGDEYIAYAGLDDGILATLDDDGVLELSVKRSVDTPTGSEMFDEVMTAYGDNVTVISGHWNADDDMPDNFNAFRVALKQGMTPEEAAFETFTGKMALRYGFTTVVVEENYLHRVVVDFYR